MKLARLIGVALALVMITSVVAMAQDGEGKRKKRRRGPDARRARGIPGVELTEEQKAAAKKIMEDARAAAREAEGREAKMAIMQEARKKIVDEVFTDEQKAKAKAARERGRGRGFSLEGLELTDEQKVKVKEIMDAAKADAETKDDRREKMKVMRAAQKTIVETVLTEEQRKKMAARRRGRGRGFGVELTEEQKAAAKVIMDAARTAAEEADGREAKREIMRTAQKKVQDEVLTDDQREQVAKRRAKMKEMRDKRGGKRRKRGPRGKRPAPDAPAD